MVGDIIKKYRTQHGLTQKELSEKIGISRGYLATIETNKNTPTTEILESIAKYFGSSVVDFIDPNGVDDIVSSKVTELIAVLLDATKKNSIEWETIAFDGSHKNNRLLSDVREAISEWTTSDLKDSEILYYRKTPDVLSMFPIVENNVTTIYLVSVDTEHPLFEYGEPEEYLIVWANSSLYPNLEKLYYTANPAYLKKINKLESIINSVKNNK